MEIYYKITLQDNKVIQIESSNTLSTDFNTPQWVASQLKIRKSTQTDLDELNAQWQLLEQQRLAREQAKALANVSDTVLTDTSNIA